MTAATWSIELPLCPEAKGNSRRILRASTGRRFIAKGEKAETFTRTAVLLMRAHHPSPFTQDDKLALWVLVRYPNYKRDLDISLICDALELAGVIPNDRQIRQIEAEAEDETGEPRIRIRLTRMGPLPWKSKARGK